MAPCIGWHFQAGPKPCKCTMPGWRTPGSANAKCRGTVRAHARRKAACHHPCFFVRWLLHHYFVCINFSSMNSWTIGTEVAIHSLLFNLVRKMLLHNSLHMHVHTYRISISLRATGTAY
jgi:hypothetical protein